MPKNKRTRVRCTLSPLSQAFKLPEISISNNLSEALRKCCASDFTLSEDSDDCVNCIKSLFRLKKIDSENYLSVLKICLYLEQYVLDLELERQGLKNQSIKRMNNSNYFIITLPPTNNITSMIMPYDKISLVEVVRQRSIWATIVEVTVNEVIIEACTSRDIYDLTENDRYDINFQSQYWPFKCCHYALKITSCREWIPVLFPELKVDCIYFDYDIDEWINPNVSKNKEQKQAVRSILNKTAFPAPYIIFGPPGTGKTATLVEAICQIIRQFPRKHILVCTGSNAAADEITKRLIRYLPINIIHRMYAPSRSWSTVDEEIRPCTNFVNGSVIFLTKELLLLKNVIVTTLITSIRLIGKNFRENHFSYIFIDEASQTTEPQMLIPMTITPEINEIHSTKFQAQIIIAGDPYQLGPIVRCRKIEHLYGISILERLMNNCRPYKKQNGKYDPNYITMLLNNYRNHESFIHISNREFYDNRLKVCGTDDTRIALNWSELPNKKFPMIFQEVYGTEERALNRSAFNKAEILVVIKYTNMLIGTMFGKHQLTQKDIGIITPFKRQQLEIMHQLELQKLEDISVGTVETFQGQERTVIILSTVRNQVFHHDGIEHIGFLSNAKRFNVAMTRAKALLIIIGNSRIICTNKYWKMVWKYCKHHGSYIPFERCPLSPHDISELINNERLNLNNDIAKSNVKKFSIALKQKKNTHVMSKTLDEIIDEILDEMDALKACT